MQQKIYSPSDGSLIAERTLASELDISDTLANAFDGQRKWQATSIAQRAEYCRAAIEWFMTNKVEIAVPMYAS